MRLAHFFYQSPSLRPNHLVDDFGNELVVIPDAECAVHWETVYHCLVINADSWGALMDIKDRDDE